MEVQEVLESVVVEEQRPQQEIAVPVPSPQTSSHPFLVPALSVAPLTPEVVRSRAEAFAEIRKLAATSQPVDIRGRAYYGWEQLAHLFPVIFQHSNITVEYQQVGDRVVAHARFRGITLGGSYVDLTVVVSDRDPIVEETKRRGGDWVKVMASKAVTQSAVRAIKFATGWAVPLIEEFVGTGADPELEQRVTLVERLRALLRDLGINEGTIINNVNRKTKAKYRSLMEIPNTILQQIIVQAERKLAKREAELKEALAEENGQQEEAEEAQSEEAEKPEVPF